LAIKEAIPTWDMLKRCKWNGLSRRTLCGEYVLDGKSFIDSLPFHKGDMVSRIETLQKVTSVDM